MPCIARNKLEEQKKIVDGSFDILGGVLFTIHKEIRDFLSLFADVLTSFLLEELISRGAGAAHVCWIVGVDTEKVEDRELNTERFWFCADGGIEGAELGQCVGQGGIHLVLNPVALFCNGAVLVAFVSDKLLESFGHAGGSTCLVGLFQDVFKLLVESSKHRFRVTGGSRVANEDLPTGQGGVGDALITLFFVGLLVLHGGGKDLESFDVLGGTGGNGGAGRGHTNLLDFSQLNLVPPPEESGVDFVLDEGKGFMVVGMIFAEIFERDVDGVLEAPLFPLIHVGRIVNLVSLEKFVGRGSEGEPVVVVEEVLHCLEPHDHRFPVRFARRGRGEGLGKVVSDRDIVSRWDGKHGRGKAKTGHGATVCVGKTEFGEGVGVGAARFWDRVGLELRQGDEVGMLQIIDREDGGKKLVETVEIRSLGKGSGRDTVRVDTDNLGGNDVFLGGNERDVRMEKAGTLAVTGEDKTTKARMDDSRVIGGVVMAMTRRCHMFPSSLLKRRVFELDVGPEVDVAGDRKGKGFFGEGRHREMVGWKRTVVAGIAEGGIRRNFRNGAGETVTKGSIERL